MPSVPPPPPRKQRARPGLFTGTTGAPPDLAAAGVRLLDALTRLVNTVTEQLDEEREQTKQRRSR